ncbi:P-loop containing nucleoside triphosphate hydrolase protein [Amanita rubescens]|nr:P-loop containing nucleoside triphosphate hydrolase protein [Amanita rubescens]
MSHVQSKVLPLLPKLADPFNPDDPEADSSSSSSPRDLLVKAKTGTGKTLAFLVPAIEKRLRSIEHNAQTRVTDAGLTADRSLQNRARRSFLMKNVGTLVISPTRELATQIANEALRLTMHPSRVSREFRKKQVFDWAKGSKDLVVATPGRLKDLLQSERGFSEALKQTQLLVLDEADSLLDMGFRDDIEEILTYLPPKKERQTFLFSATVSPAIQQVARASLDSNHKFINCVTEDDVPVHTKVKQYHTVLPSAADQLPHVIRLLAHEQLTNPGSSKTIVFLPTTKQTQLFTSLLREMKGALPAGNHTQIYEMHSKRTMATRQTTPGCSILVTSDVSARGVDYPGVTRVIQVGIPATTDQYVHRVGRTGRAGAAGRQGRGDLVLLPWEMDFVTWELKTMPLKPVTVSELDRQMTELAEELDANPQTYFSTYGPKVEEVAQEHWQNQRGFGAIGRVRSRAPFGPELFTTPYTRIAKDIEGRTETLRDEIDEEAIDETFMAMLGFYSARSTELRMDRQAVLEVCKQWAVQAGGMTSPPMVSPSMMQKLGIPRSSTESEPSRKFGLRSPRADRWMGGGEEQSSSYGNRDGLRSSYGNRGGERSSYGNRDGQRSSYGNRDGQRSSYGQRIGTGLTGAERKLIGGEESRALAG